MTKDQRREYVQDVLLRAIDHLELPGYLKVAATAWIRANPELSDQAVTTVLELIQADREAHEEHSGDEDHEQEEGSDGSA